MRSVAQCRTYLFAVGMTEIRRVWGLAPVLFTARMVKTYRLSLSNPVTVKLVMVALLPGMSRAPVHPPADLGCLVSYLYFVMVVSLGFAQVRVA